jgi:CDP-diacylglycerol--glycerol-3-phosphate 3-phosphatidyltransferase
MAFNLEVLRYPMYRIIEPATRWLVRNRVHPNVITTFGFIATVSSGYFYHQDHVRVAGFLVLFGGLFDLFDGRVARISGLASKFGAFYDSVLDRMSEVAMYLGLLSLYVKYQSGPMDLVMIYVIMVAAAGSIMVSYTRARAEGLGLDCSVGLMQRPERVVAIGAASLFFGLMWEGLVLTAVIVIVAILTNITVIQRMVWVYQRATGVPLDDMAASGPDEEPTSVAENDERNP